MTKTRSLSGVLLLFTVAVLATCCISVASAAEYRAFWVDAWGAGVLNQSQVDTLLGVAGNGSSLGQIRQANCNTVIVQVRRNCDANYPSSMGEPYMSGLTPSDFNSLQAVINAAHDTTGGKKRIEVHAWIVTFRTSGGLVYQAHDDPPTGSLAELDNYWPSRTSSGAEASDKAFDPGHPLAEEYTVNVAMDIVNNFDVDGIHFDYIRFTGGDQGYNPTSIARYNARYGLSGQPSSTDDQFDQWRRDQISNMVRKVYAKVQASKPSVKVSGSFVTWNPSPTASTRAAFQTTRPYGNRTDGVFCDWDSWMTEGIVDIAVPMTYYNYDTYPGDWANWINFEKDRHGDRHMIIGPGIYLNSLSNAILELQQTRTESPSHNYADGFSGYSYRVPYNGGTWEGFSPTLVSDVTSEWANIPSMSWKTNPTKGHISGTVTYLADGRWVDGATVTMAGPVSRSMLTDGTGFYAFIDLTPGTYLVTVQKTGYPQVQRNVTVAIGSVTGNMYVNDFTLGGVPPPTITDVRSTGVGTTSATVVWTTDQAATSQVEYGTTTSYGSLTPVDTAQVAAHSVALSGLAQSTLHHYRVKSGNANGNSTSADYTFITNGPPYISNVQVTDITSSGATITWTTATASNGSVNYGLTSSYGSSASDPNTNTTSHSVTISGLSPETTYHYQCVSTNAYGTQQTTDATFATTAVVNEVVIDNTDPGWSNTSPSGNTWSSGTNTAVPKIGTNYLYTGGSGSTSTITRSCRWTPTLSVTGTYDVYVYYQLGSNRNSAAPYKVYYNGGNQSSVQNQYSSTPNQGGWFLIGSDLPFVAGSAGYVELTNASTDTAYVSADAAKFVLKQATDTTPPVMSSITDDDRYTASTNTLNATWAGSDPESGILRYEYAVGTTSGGTQAKGWTSAGTSTSTAIGGLSLTIGQTYYVSARAVNGQNLTSSAITAPGVVVARSVSSIAAAKAYANNEPVALPPSQVSAKFTGCLYVQETDRFSGIRVEPSDASVGVNQMAQVFGRLGLLSEVERTLTSSKIVPGDVGADVRPFVMQNPSVGGQQLNSLTPGITDAFGLYNIGLLVSVVGTVTESQSSFIYVDDGSGLMDGTGNMGVRVDTTYLTSSPAKDKHVVITGICTVYDTGTASVRMIRPRSDADVVTYN